jgi:hypothetical protein
MRVVGLTAPVSRALAKLPNLLHPGIARFKRLFLLLVAFQQFAVGYDVAGNGTRLSEGFGDCNAGSDRYLDDFGGWAWGSGAAGE